MPLLFFRLIVFSSAVTDKIRLPSCFINAVQAAAVRKEREVQKKLLKKERKTFRTIMKV